MYLFNLYIFGILINFIILQYLSIWNIVKEKYPNLKAFSRVIAYCICLLTSWILWIIIIKFMIDNEKDSK